MKRRYQRLARSKWKAHIKAWQQSGSSQAEYCRQHGLSDKVFSLWKRRFQKAASEDSVPADTPAQDEVHGSEFIPPHVVPSSPEKDILLLRLPNGIELRLTSNTFNHLDVNLVSSLCQIR